MNPPIFRPMLAIHAPKDLTKLPWPMLASPKLDGIRGIIQDGVMYSRSLKKIPSEAAQQIARRAPVAYNHFEGELMASDGHDPFSSVMTNGDLRPLSLNVFDTTEVSRRNSPYSARSAHLNMVKNLYPNPYITVIPQTLLFSADELKEYEETTLANGHEGVVLRHPDSPYKYGRSTVKQSWMLKVVQFKTAEARVIDFRPLQQNNNAPAVSALGLTERGHSQGNKQTLDTLGAIVVEDLRTGHIFSIGTGFSETLRKQVWDYRSWFLHTIITYKYKGFGQKELPRQPVFIRFRNDVDMGM